MNKNKSKKIIIIAMIVIVLIIIAISAYIVLATDMLKSDKDLFMKYLGEVADTENGFIEKNVIEYYQKKGTSFYQHELDFKVTGESDIPTDSEHINDMNVHISGQVDNHVKKRFADVSINYSDNVSFPFKVILGQDMQGIQTEYIGGKYIASTGSETAKIKPEEIKAIEDRIANLPNIQKANLQFVVILQEELANATFLEVNNNNEVGYQATLTGANIKNIIQKAKQVPELKDSVNLSTEDIEDSATIQLVVYPRNNHLGKIEMVMEEKKISIEKNSADNDITYTLTYQASENLALTLNLKCTGIQSMQNVNETYELAIDSKTQRNNSNGIQLASEKQELNLLVNRAYSEKMAGNSESKILTKEDIEAEITDEKVTVEQLSNNGIKITFTETNNAYEIDETRQIVKEPEENTQTNTSTMKIRYQINNQVNFSDTVNIETLNSDNALILEEMDEEAKDNFLNAVEERISSVNETQMEELSLKPSENPLFMVLQPRQALIYNMTLNAANNPSINEEEITAFNQKFLNYEGTNIKGTTVKGLLSFVGVNNTKEGNVDRRITQIHLKGEEHELESNADALNQKLEELKTQIENEKEYRVEFEKDEDTGVINRAVINEK